jgi:hypothetical protein
MTGYDRTEAQEGRHHGGRIRVPSAVGNRDMMTDEEEFLAPCCLQDAEISTLSNFAILERL